MGGEIIILSEIIHTQKDTHHVFLHMHNLNLKTSKQTNEITWTYKGYDLLFEGRNQWMVEGIIEGDVGQM
jgi:hypothetical protein